MSGHSKWNNIKHKKENADAAKAKIFTKIGKEMAVAIKAGGPDPNNNSKLRDLIAKAKANNVPNDNIQSYPGDNRLISPKSSHRRGGLAYVVLSFVYFKYGFPLVIYYGH